MYFCAIEPYLLFRRRGNRTQTIFLTYLIREKCDEEIKISMHRAGGLSWGV